MEWHETEMFGRGAAGKRKKAETQGGRDGGGKEREGERKDVKTGEAGGGQDWARPRWKGKTVIFMRSCS